MYPSGNGTTQLTDIGIKVAKNAYGNGFSNGLHNMLYCRVTAEGPIRFALMASSKSGSIFTYKSDTGGITSASAWPDTGSVVNCQSAGINQTGGTDRDILYHNGAWQSYVGG